MYCCCDVFFFKQKTAYEMRISDWSSDVCSSDLVVNAIDDDHRDGIWRTFFEDGLLHGKQVILTSHAEEFLHRIQQELGVRRAAAIKRYKFLPHQGEHELRVDSDPPSKNYVLLAQQALAADEKSEELRQARPAQESLTDRLWTWLGRRADGRLDIKLAGRSEEHTSELQSLMRISYAVFCLTKKKKTH